ncbi:MAG: Ig-like domain-containing protein [Gemmatimonadetes bacterium]|nr:Ig-like domain-containing protein [Gemmatimonadota bacterium]
MMIRNPRTAADFAITLILSTLAVACEETTEPDSGGQPSAIATVSAATQAGTVGAAVATPPRVRVTDQTGAGAPGVIVRFSVLEGGGFVTGSAPETDANGEAAVGSWVLGTAPGPQRLSARVEGLDPVLFQATASPGPAARIRIASGDGQTGRAGEVIDLAVTVMDEFANPVGANASVHFEVVSGGGSVGTSTGTTGPDSRALREWTLGGQLGMQSARARLTNGASVLFTAHVNPGPATVIRIVSGDGQTGTAGQLLRNELVVEIEDAFGNKAAGDPLAFMLSDDGFITPAQPTADHEGRARVAWTLARQPGANAAKASVAGGASVTFNAVGQVGPPAGFRIISGDQQSAPAGTTLQPIVVEVIDAAGNPAGPGIGVTFASTFGGGVFSPAAATTDVNSRAQSTWTLGFTAGTNTGTVALSNHPAIAMTITATVTTGASNQIAIVSGDGQTAGAGATLPLPLVVRVFDGLGQPVPGATVNFAVNTGGGSISAAQVLTNAAGEASVTWTLGGVTGIQNVAASLPTGASVLFTANVVSGPPALLVLVSGDAQTGTAGASLPAPLVMRVTDSGGNPVAGATVTFTVTGGGGSFSPTSAVTGATGLAQSTWTLGSVPGANTGVASLPVVVGQDINVSATGQAPPFGVIALGDFSCGIANVGFCWGPNGQGQIGDGTTTQRTQPTLVTGPLAFSMMSVGQNHACGIVSGTAYCWGANADGQIGDGTTTATSTPTIVSGGNSFARISAGLAFTCAVTTTGTALCWGRNSSGQLGDGTTVAKSTPTAVSGAIVFASIHTGGTFACGLDTTGAAFCWGANSDGQIGDGTTVAKTTPTAVSGGFTFASLSTGAAHACALDALGAARCWGENGFGTVGDGTTTDRTAPTAVSGGFVFTMVDAGADHTCGVTTAGAARCWGRNVNGQLGDGTMTQSSTPIAVSGGYTFNRVEAGAAHSCGTTAGTSYCWGLNNGRLGDGTTTQSLIPVAVIQP